MNSQSNHTKLARFLVEDLIRDTNFKSTEARSQVLQVWKNDVQGLVGSTTWDGTVAMAEITTHPVQLAHVGFIAIPEKLSNQKDFPTFLRVNPMFSELMHGINGLLKRTR